MKELTITAITAGKVAAQQIPALFDSLQMGWHDIDTLNWKNEFPYAPEVKFRIAYNSSDLLLHYKVTEDSVAAVAEADGGNVWEDSCCECFIQPADDGIYYNLECNCAGTLLLAAGTSRNGRTPAPGNVLKSIDRWASLGRGSFAERKGLQTWELALTVPFTAWFQHHIESLDGMTLRGNFYKCGDKLSQPHFVTWNTIRSATPDYHRPECFGIIHC